MKHFTKWAFVALAGTIIPLTACNKADNDDATKPTSEATQQSKTHPQGYKESDTDYKKDRANDLAKEKKPGYYDGTYHNQSPNFKPNDEQIIEAGKNVKKD